MAFGVFDKLHPGHRWFLQRARRWGTYLVVVVPPDTEVRKIKNHSPVFAQADRITMVRPWCDRAVRGDRRRGEWGVIQRFKPAAIVTGYDQTELRRALRAYKTLHPHTPFRLITLPGKNTRRWKSSLT